MRFERVDDRFIEIFPEGADPEELLQTIARLSYESAESPAPFYVQPFEVPADRVDFRGLLQGGELHMEYLNGRLCSTHVELKKGRYYFDAALFLEDRGSPEAFLMLVQERLAKA